MFNENVISGLSDENDRFLSNDMRNFSNNFVHLNPVPASSHSSACTFESHSHIQLTTEA